MLYTFFDFLLLLPHLHSPLLPFPDLPPLFRDDLSYFWAFDGVNIPISKKILSWNMSFKLLIFSVVLNRFYTWYESLKNIFIKNKRVEICENLLGVVFLFY